MLFGEEQKQNSSIHPYIHFIIPISEYNYNIYSYSNPYNLISRSSQQAVKINPSLWSWMKQLPCSFKGGFLFSQINEGHGLMLQNFCRTTDPSGAKSLLIVNR